MPTDASTVSDNVATRPKLLSPALCMYFVAAFGSMTSFYLLLSVVPLYATSSGAGNVGAGFTTGAFMLATVAAELATPTLLARFGYRVVLAAGLILLGAPALVLAWSASLATILAICLVRGVGLAILVVAGSALVAVLVPAERRSEGIGVSGVVVGVPSVVALPLGLWLAAHIGFAPVFVAGAAASLLCLGTIPALPARASTSGDPVGVLAGLRMPGQVRPALIFFLTAMATGAVVTFLPLATRGSGRLAAAALFANMVATTVARWAAGHHGHRHQHGQTGLLVTGVVLGAAGMLLLAFTMSAWLVGAGALVLGIGFGLAQNTSLTLMFDRVSAEGYGMVSALWNLAYDAGMGVGAAGFGVLVTRSGYPAGFALVGVVMLVALAPVWRDRGWMGHGERNLGGSEG
ncbi:MAG: MFS transporter [Gemmatimonadales bacterium]